MLGIFLLPSCQDDPVLEDLENGIPVITPKSNASIFLVQLNSFPPVDPVGITWDIPVPDPTLPPFHPNADPDIFFNFTDPSPQPPVFWSQPSHYANISGTDPL